MGKIFKKEKFVFASLVVAISLLAPSLILISSAAVGVIIVSPSSAIVPMGSTLQLSASASDVGGAPTVPAPAFNWASSNTAIGTVSASGLFTPVAVGNVTITATDPVSGINGASAITVAAAGSPNFASISATQIRTSVEVGSTYQLSALALGSDGWPISPQPTFTWSSSDNAIATVSASGLLTGVSVGIVTLTVSSMGVSNTTTMNIIAPIVPVVSSIVVAPRNSIAIVGATQQFSATAYDYAYSMNPLNPQPTFTWSSSDMAVGTIDPSGLFTAIAPGIATITASAAGINGTSTITVNPVGGATFATISISSASGAGAFGANIPNGYTVQLQATAWDASGFNKVNPQPTFTWSSSNTAVATVDTTGFFSAVGYGTVTITASSMGVSASKTTTVGNGNVINSSAGANGSISPLGVTTILPGASQVYVITPNAGFSVADVLVDGVSVSAVTTYTFTNVQTPHVISATFVQTPITNLNLVVGWNLVSWTNAAATTAGNIINSHPGANVVSKFDAATQTWINFIAGNPLNNFAVNPNDALFVHKQ